MTSSIDVKIANAQRRAAEEKAQAGLAGNRPTPPMDANDRKMIVGDIAKALEAKKAAQITQDRLSAILFPPPETPFLEKERSWKAWEEWAGIKPAPEPTPEQQAAFFGVSDAPKTYKIRRLNPYLPKRMLPVYPNMEFASAVPGVGQILQMWTAGGRLFAAKSDGKQEVTFEIVDGVAIKWDGAPTASDPLGMNGLRPGLADNCQTTEG